MARPRGFDEDEVLERALQLFWQRGYEGASLADIEAATGLGRASLYGAFGDKEGLFAKVLERFRCRYDGFAQRLEQAESAREGFEAAFETWLEANCAERGPRGCLLQLAATSGASDLPRIQAITSDASRSTEALFRRVLERARKSGELPPRADVRVRARYLAVFLEGLSSAARNGRSRRELKPLIALALDAVFCAADRGSASTDG